jgi:hypothetical protein
MQDVGLVDELRGFMEAVGGQNSFDHLRAMTMTRQLAGHLQHFGDPLVPTHDRPRHFRSMNGHRSWTTSLSLARPICAKSYVPMPATIMEGELTDRWTKTRPSIAQLSALASCGHVLFLADFITSTFGFSFQYTQLLPMLVPEGK